VVVVLEPAAPRQAPRAPSGLAAARPRLGQPCRIVDRYPVSFATEPGGAWVASFAFAGGTTRGHVTVPGMEANLLAEYDVYAADVRLGSYEPSRAASQRGGLVCVVDPTYHLYCPANGAVGQFCLSWVRKPGG
jgi:hypothetical protein